MSDQEKEWEIDAGGQGRAGLNYSLQQRAFNTEEVGTQSFGEVNFVTNDTILSIFLQIRVSSRLKKKKKVNY